jgi:hypothetical protein
MGIRIHFDKGDSLMGKKPGILEKLKNKKQSPVPTRRIAVPELEEDEMRGAPVIIPVADDIEYLEDMPSDAVSQYDDAGKSHRTKAAAVCPKPVAGSLNMSKRHRSNQTSFGSKLSVAKNTVLGKRTRESAALDFAMNHKRVNKRQRRKRLLLTYIGTGIVVAAVLLVVVFVPGGKAASTADANPSSDRLEVAAVNDMTTKSGAAAAPTVQVSPSDVTSEEPTVSLAEISELEGEESGLPVESVEPTIEPTEESVPIATTAPDILPQVTLDDCIPFFIVEADKYYKYSTNHYEYTEDDIYMLAQIITSEARGESLDGMVAVGNVVMNRVLNRHKFANSIQGVITAAGQFAYNSGTKPTSGAQKAARKVLQDEVWVIAQDVYYFRSGSSAVKGVDWSSHKYYTKIGGHCFYSDSYSGRQRGGDPPPRLFERTYKYAQYGCKPEERVYRIQYMLNKLGYDVKADRYFGKDSVDALKAFQEKYGMEADGVAGPTTVSKLIDVFGITNYFQQFLVEQ